MKHLTRWIGPGILLSALGAATVTGCGDGGEPAGDGDGDGSGDGDSTGDGDGDGDMGGAPGDGDAVESYDPGDEIPLGLDNAQALVLTGFPHVIERAGERVLVAGVFESDFWIARYDHQGDPDPSFGTAGESLVAFPEGAPVLEDPADYDSAFGLEQHGTSIYVAGAAQGWMGISELRWGVAKLTADGELDTSFADEGTKVIDWTIASRAFHVDVTTEDQLLVTGTIENTTTDIAIVRMDLDGTVDDSFSLTGSGAGAVVSDNGYEDGMSLLQLEDGLVVGFGNDFGVAGLELDGPYDTSFGTAGWSHPTDGIAYASELTDDGKILIVGTAPPNEETDAVDSLQLVQLLADGTLDETFGDGGVALVPYDFGNYVWPELDEQIELEDAFVRVNGISRLPDGKLLILADVLGFLARYPVLLRLNADASLDTTFGSNGLIAFPLVLPLLGGLTPEPASRLASDGATAWFVEETVTAEGNVGVLVRVELN